jgi:hypothetical protein
MVDYLLKEGKRIDRGCGAQLPYFVWTKEKKRVAPCALPDSSQEVAAASPFPSLCASLFPQRWQIARTPVGDSIT